MPKTTPGNHLCSFGSPILESAQSAPALPWHCFLVTIALLSTMIAFPDGIHCSNHPNQSVHRRACWGSLHLSFLPPLICLRHHSSGRSPGKWCQFASNLSKHFTGEHLYLHLPTVGSTTCGHTRIHMHNSVQNYTHTHRDMTASN